MGSELKFHNLDIVIRRIKSVGGGAPGYMKKLLNSAMEEDVVPEWKKHIGLTDHTLQELAKLGYPYARRCPTDSFVHPDSEVHIQSGDLIAATEVNEIDANGQYAVRLANTNPVYEYLRYGTALMRPRDPAAATMRDALPKIKSRLSEGVKNAVIEYFKR